MPNSGANTLTILGCDPPADAVKLTFRRIYQNIQASGESIAVAVQGGGVPGLFFFEPPAAQPGALFALDLHLNSPDCPTGNVEEFDTWTPGSTVSATFALPGGGSLLGSTNGKDVPLAQKGEFKAGGVWSTNFEFTTTPKGHVQTFLWSSSLKWLTGGTLQASVLPFPSATEGDLLNPPGLVASWPVTCSDCVFSVDLSVLAPKPPEPPKNLGGKVSSFFEQVFQVIAKGASKAWNWASSLFVQAPAPGSAIPLMGNPVEQPDSSLALIGAGKLTPPVISFFYFRVVPLAGTQIGGSATNPVRIRWYVEDEFSKGIAEAIFCVQNPGAPNCPTPIPPPKKPYTAEIIGYHGIVAPQYGHEGCYLVTKTTTITQFGTKVTYPAGTKFCPPKPKAKAWYEAVVDFIVDAVNYVSEAYNDLKDTVVSIVANFVPDAICNKACLGTLLDAGLMALGIPPSIPNFDQLMNEGLDYLASQAAAQLSIPKEVYDALPAGATQLMISQAEEAWKAEAEKQIKQGVQKGLEAAQVTLSESVSFVPDGVPIKPDPFGDYQPPTLTLKVTRDPTVPLEADMCFGQPGIKGNLWVLPWVTVSKEEADGFNSWIASKDQQMQANHSYNLYETKFVPLPVLAPGETQIIPIVLKPTMYDYFGTIWTSSSDAEAAYSTWYWNGNMDLSVSNPCTYGDTIQGEPNQSFGQ